MERAPDSIRDDAVANAIRAVGNIGGAAFDGLHNEPEARAKALILNELPLRHPPSLTLRVSKDSGQVGGRASASQESTRMVGERVKNSHAIGSQRRGVLFFKLQPRFTRPPSLTLRVSNFTPRDQTGNDSYLKHF